MKIFFIILAVAHLLFGLVGTIVESDGILLFAGVILGGFWGFMAWLWRGKSPVKRAGEQIGNAVDKAKGKHQAYTELSPSLKRRTWKLRIIGVILCLIGAYILIKGFGSVVLITIATFFLIGGVTCMIMANPGEYNESVDMGSMIGFNSPTTIEKVYEDFKNLNTPLGSCYLATFKSMKAKAIVYGPDAGGNYVYFWLTKSGDVGYIGSSFVTSLIKERITEPLHPVSVKLNDNVAINICYNADVMRFQKDFREIMIKYGKSGIVQEFRRVEESEVYMFTEEFKLTGQHFDLTDTEGNKIYEIDGTIPLINLRIFDTDHKEVFKMTKEIGHALATYNFYQDGQLYGTLEEQVAFVRDEFSMNVKEGKLELTEYAGTIGHNFQVTINGRMIGCIMDDLRINVQNMFFDNAVIVVYDKKYRALLTAMAVMVARELARDEDGGLTNRI